MKQELSSFTYDYHLCIIIIIIIIITIIIINHSTSNIDLQDSGQRSTGSERGETSTGKVSLKDFTG